MSHRCLIVDDEPDLAAVAADYLIREGFEVTVAGDGEQALSVARQKRQDVIVLDLMGVQVAELNAVNSVAIEWAGVKVTG